MRLGNVLSGLVLLACVCAFSSEAEAEACTCGNISDKCPVCSYDWGSTHFRIDTWVKEYDPDENGDEQNNVFSHEYVEVGTQNNSCGTIIVDDTVSASVYENRTMSATAGTTQAITVAAESSFGICKGSIGYTGSFEISGTYGVEQGTQITKETTIHDLSIPSGKESYWKVKFYKKTSEVSCTATKDHKCLMYHGDPIGEHFQVYEYPDHGEQGVGAAAAYKYQKIMLSYEGLRDVT